MMAAYDDMIASRPVIDEQTKIAGARASKAAANATPPVDGRAALAKLTGGQTLTDAERAYLNLSATTDGGKDEKNPLKTITDTKDNGDGTYTVFYSDGTSEIKGTKITGGGGGNTGGGSTTTDTKKADAYQRLYDEFNALGLGALVQDGKELLMKVTSIAAMPDALRGTKAYMDRFSANDARIKAGLAALSPAEYLAKEDAYQNIMRNYGLPESYYKTGLYGKQEGFEKLLANDVSAVELEDRIATAQQRVLNSNPEVLAAIKNFYGDSITNGDILAYALNPQKGLEDIKKKVTAAEIQGAANIFGLNKITKESTPAEIKALEARAAALAGQGINKEQALAGYETISQVAPRGSELAAIYKESPYGQAEAEAEVFKTAGAAEATKKRKRLVEKETASFSGSSGVGALGRDRANPYGTSQSGYGQY